MAKLPLTFACGDYDRTRALWDGSLQPEGVDLDYLALPPREIFWRMLRHGDFDASELSLSAYLLGLSRGDTRFVAIPVFPLRVFRHSYIFVNADAGIQAPRDLTGKRIGVPEYHMTAALWIRGLLEHEYGVRPQDMTWFRGGQERPGRKERVEVHLPPGVRMEEIGPLRTLDAMLENGEIDALATARAPIPFEQGSPLIRRLFPNARAVEQEYYRHTGIFPIMHVVVIKRDIYERNPWVAQSLYKALLEAKQRCYEGMRDHASRYSLPWFLLELEEEQRLLGEDFWPYGVEANRATLEAVTLYSYEQGLSERHLSVQELFTPNTLDAYVD